MENYISTVKRNVSIQLVLVCVFCHAIIITNGYTLKKATTSIKLPSRNFQVDRRRLVSPGVVFGTCETFAPHKNETSCFFGIETKSNVGLPEHVRYCNITHTSRNHEYRKWSGEFRHIVAIDEDKAVFTVGYSIYADMSILLFSDCRVIPVDVTGMMFTGVIATIDGTFDVFSFNGDQTMRTVVDFEGNIIKEQQESKAPIHDEVIMRSPTKGYLSVRGNDFDDYIEVLASSNQGSMEVLKRYAIDPPIAYESPRDKYTFSVTHQMLSVCSEHQSEIICGQFDQNAVLKFEITIPIPESFTRFYYGVFNLRRGGLLFVSHNRRLLETAYVTVTIFDDTGRQIGSLQTEEVEEFPVEVRNSRFFVNEKKEFCFSSFHECYGNDPCITLNVACFTGDDLIPSELK